MEKVKVTICDRDYSLLTDEPVHYVHKLSKMLEDQIEQLRMATRGRTETELATLTAISILDELEKAKQKLITFQEEVESVKTGMKEKDETIVKLQEQLHSAGSEMANIAEEKERESNELRAKLLDYEKTFQQYSKRRDDEILQLKAAFESAHSEMNQIAIVKDEENVHLRNSMSTYENTIEQCNLENQMKLKEYRAQIEMLKIKNEELTRLLEEISS